MRNLQDLNILIGGNDSGKSNILRALNLFFNGKISDFEELSFLEDVTHLRQQEVKDTKGRLTIWIKIQFNNIESWKTLPNKFFIKKSWNRYTNIPEITYDKNANQTSITKFINKIKFHYVPAVKHPDIYSHYLRELYNVISNDPDIDLRQPVQNLSKSINETIVEMSVKIQTAIGVASSIDIPVEFGELFERLSFMTKQNEYNVPLSKRGDGIQARHIPHILEYISENNKKHNIWAYEEPENSLEMMRSFQVAEQFQNDFSKSNQIFVSTHSPAFYGLHGNNISKFMISKEIKNEFSEVSTVQNYSNNFEADKSLGIAGLIAERSKDLFKEIEALNILNSKLSLLDRPVIITEGSSDARILKEACNRLFDTTDRYEIICCEEKDGIGGGASKLHNLLKRIPHSDSRIRIGLFDRDVTGISAYQNLSDFMSDDLFDNIKSRPNSNVHAMLLPMVSWDHENFELAGKPVEIEMMFSPDTIGRELIQTKFDGGGSSICKTLAEELIADKPIEQARKIVKCTISITNKNLSLRRILEAPDKEFEPFRQIFEAINSKIVN